jgi:hypothetical protein
MSYDIKRVKNRAFVWHIWVKSDFSENGVLSAKQVRKIEKSFANADIFDYVKHGDIIKNDAYPGYYSYNVFFVYKLDDKFKLCNRIGGGIPRLFTDTGLFSKKYWGTIGRILEK